MTAVAAILTGIAALWAGALPEFLFSLVLPPVGFILAEAGTKEGSTRKAASWGILYLVAVWLFAAWLLNMAGGGNPYQALRAGLDQGFDATFALYKETGNLSADDLAGLKFLIEQIKTQAARVFPALLLSSGIIVIWVNIILARWLLKRKSDEAAGGEELKSWRLPDLLVWPLILAGFALLAPEEELRTFGLNTGLALLVLYLSQGLAVVASLMQKWSLPQVMRVITYGLLFIQVYGLLFLALIGLVDVWADFRKQSVETETDDAPAS